eukprot:m.53384 g.53384  ORF g.53384 m.53384 type:complete len:314 (+) comp10865_c0_seq2:213-1154(+)
MPVKKKSTYVANPVFEAGFQNLTGSSSNPREFILKKGDEKHCPPQVKTFLEAYKAVYAFTGHGANNQIKDISEIHAHLDTVVEDLDKKHTNNNGQRTWLACYGGDPYDKHKQDIAAVMHYLAHRHKVHVLAVQCEEYGFGKYGIILDDGKLNIKPFGHLRATVIYETDYDGNKKILFGGHKRKCRAIPKHSDLQLVGASRYILGNLFDGKLKGQISCGGGPIAVRETELALLHFGLNILYIPTTVKYSAPAFTLKKEKPDDHEVVSLEHILLYYVLLLREDSTNVIYDLGMPNSVNQRLWCLAYFISKPWVYP